MCLARLPVRLSVLSISESDNLKVRVRVPMDMVLVATSAGVLNATEQTVSFDRTAWAKTAALELGAAQVQAIVVTLRCRGECSK